MSRHHPTPAQGPLEGSRLVQPPPASPAFPFWFVIENQGERQNCGRGCGLGLGLVGSSVPLRAPPAPPPSYHTPQRPVKGWRVGGLPGNPSCSMGAVLQEGETDRSLWWTEFHRWTFAGRQSLRHRERGEPVWVHSAWVPAFWGRS